MGVDDPVPSIEDIRTGGPIAPGAVPARQTGAAAGEVLDLVVAVAVSLVPAATAASVCILPSRGGCLRTVAASSQLAHDLDSVQLDSGRGPVIDTVGTGEEARASLPADRWPELSARAGALRTDAVWALPVNTDDRGTAGALTLYARGGRPWQDNRAATSRLMAALVSLELGNSAAMVELANGNATLREALETRTVIGQAQGMLMATEGITADEAFDILRRASQRTNRKLRDIATELVAKGSQPRRRGNGK